MVRGYHTEPAIPADIKIVDFGPKLATDSPPATGGLYAVRCFLRAAPAHLVPEVQRHRPGPQGGSAPPGDGGSWGRGWGMGVLVLGSWWRGWGMGGDGGGGWGGSWGRGGWVAGGQFPPVQPNIMIPTHPEKLASRIIPPPSLLPKHPLCTSTEGGAWGGQSSHKLCLCKGKRGSVVSNRFIIAPSQLTGPHTT